MEKLVSEILKQFFVEIQIKEIKPLSGGLINETLLVKTDKGEFVLQKINQKIFHNMHALLENKKKVVRHLKRKNFPTANFLETLGHENFCIINANYWQISEFIPSKNMHQLNEKIAFKTGKLLAEFHHALLDFPINELHCSIPDFHNTEKRFAQFIETCSKASSERIDIAAEEIEFLKENYYKIEPLASAINRKEVPIRVVHNDTKVANILFDNNDNPICFIDFDTLMPGSILHDIGDALRSGANASNENEKDLNKVIFKKEVYAAFIKGYLSFAKSFISEIELKNIHLALPLILFEQATRFLEDYLKNDTYYPVDYADQNLVRTKTQLKLFKEFNFYASLFN